MWEYNCNELYHHGVKGMKWGVRKVKSIISRGPKKQSDDNDGAKPDSPNRTKKAPHLMGGPRTYSGSKKSQLKAYKRDLEVLDNGGHFSVGLTKKRQAAYDARDRKILNKRISELEAKVNKKAVKETDSKDSKTLVKRTVDKGAKVVGKLATAAVMDQFVTGGVGRKVVKETVKQTGRAAVTAYTMARGGYDIRWYDN